MKQQIQRKARMDEKGLTSGVFFYNLLAQQFFNSFEVVTFCIMGNIFVLQEAVILSFESHFFLP